MRERSRSPRAPRRRRRVGLVSVVLLIVGGWFVLLNVLGRRLQRGRQQRLGAEVDAAAEGAQLVEIDTFQPPDQPLEPPAAPEAAALKTEHGAPTRAALETDAAVWTRYKRDVEATKIHAVIVVRIYDGDKAKLTLPELEQWIQYMRYVGVRRIYLYDNWQEPGESLEKWAEATQEPVVYHDWGKKPIGRVAYDKGGGASAFGPFKPAYEHALKYYGGDSRWQVAFDMDEYPIAPQDLEPGSLCRAVAAYSAKHPDVSELSLKNYGIIGPNDKSVPWIMERYTRKTKDPMNNLDKPIYRTNAVRTWAFNHNRLSKGRSKDLPPEKLHFNHFWGARTFGWGHAIPGQLLANTDEYRVAAELTDAVRAWTDVRRRRLGSEAVQPPPASFLSS